MGLQTILKELHSFQQECLEVLRRTALELVRFSSIDIALYITRWMTR